MKKWSVIGALVLCLMLGIPSIGNYGVFSDQAKVGDDTKSMVVEPSYPDYTLPAQDTMLNILAPRSTMPVIVRHNDAFMVTVSFDAVTPTWRVSISTAYDLVTETFFLTIIDTTYNVNKGQWLLTVGIPTDVTTELYNLTVESTVDNTIVLTEVPRAVSVVNAYKSNFSFVHLADFHIGDPRGFTEDINRTLGWKAAKKSIDEINLLNPDFVIISGDLVFGQLYPFEYSIEYWQCYNILQRFQVPTYVAPGNHDGYIQFGQDGFDFWEQYFGPRYYSFDYGAYHFTAVNSYDWPDRSRWAFSFIAFNWGGTIREEQLAWLEADAQSAVDAPLSFMFLHHNPLWDTVDDSLRGNGYAGRQELLSIIDTYEIDAVLAGHVHWDDVTLVNDTLYLTTTTVSSGLSTEDSYWGYRLITVINDTLSSYNYREPKYSIPLYRINASIDNNDGTSTNVAARLENDLDIDITISLDFYVPEGSYVIENGNIVDMRTDGITLKIIVDALVPAQSEIEVRVHPA